MKDEIKEILDFIKEQIEKETLSYEPDIELSKEEAKLLLNYITNLQTIEQQYSAILSENAELENKITNLQKENKQLKEDIKELFKENENKEKVIIIKDNIIKEATEYIKDLYDVRFTDKDKRKLLEILGEKENE